MVEPSGLAPPSPQSSLPTRDAETLQLSIAAAERSKYVKHCSRITKALGEAEQVIAAAPCVSGKPGLIAVTNQRVLFANKPDVITPMALGQWSLSNISSVRPVSDGLLVGRKQPPGDLGFKMSREIAESFVEPFKSVGIGLRPAPVPGRAPTGPDRGALRVLPEKTTKLALQHIAPDETVFLCLVGASGQSLVALGDRLLIVKAGFMSGHAFGGQVIAFPYREITGLEIQTHLATAVLQIQTASFSGTRPGGYWTNDKSTDPFKLPNCLPIGSKKTIGAWQGHLSTLRRAIAAGGFADERPSPGSDQPPASPTAAPAIQLDPADGLAEEIRKLASLRDSGLLTDAEFAQAKAKLLS